MKRLASQPGKMQGMSLPIASAKPEAFSKQVGESSDAYVSSEWPKEGLAVLTCQGRRR